MRQISDHSKDIRSMDNFLLDSLTILGNTSSHYSVEYELFVVHKFNASEGCNRTQEQFSCLVEITNEHTVDTFKNFKLVFLIPISTIIN